MVQAFEVVEPPLGIPPAFTQWTPPRFDGTASPVVNPAPVADPVPAQLVDQLTAVVDQRFQELATPINAWLARLAPDNTPRIRVATRNTAGRTALQLHVESGKVAAIGRLSDSQLDAAAAVPLYESVGWVRYTADLARLRRGVRRIDGDTHCAHRRRGAVKLYGHCPFFLLSTDPPGSAEAAKSHPFYRSMGLVPHEEQDLVAFGLPVERRL